MTALIRMRLAGMVRTGKALAPLLANLVALSILYGGGQARPAEAYGLSAIILFPVIAWQTKVLLDVEPDVQRRLARIAVGGAGREIGAGVIASTTVGLGTLALGMVMPWLFSALETEGAGLSTQIMLGVWAHMLALIAGVALGCLASRAVIGSAGNGIAVLVGGSVAMVVFGLTASPIPWAMPPMMAVARAIINGHTPTSAVVLLTMWGLIWTAVCLTGYTLLRQRRA